MSFGEVLRGYIEASRFKNQRQFALAIGMEPTYLNRIIKGNVQRPETETLAKMADTLGVPYPRLLDEAGYPSLPADTAMTAVPVPPTEGDRPFDPALIVRFVESKPDEVFQAALAQEKQRRKDKPGSYERLCLRIYRAWTSNADLESAFHEAISRLFLQRYGPIALVQGIRAWDTIVEDMGTGKDIAAD